MTFITTTQAAAILKIHPNSVVRSLAAEGVKPIAQIVGRFLDRAIAKATGG